MSQNLPADVAVPAEGAFDAYAIQQKWQERWAEADPFRAPDADRLATLGLDRLTLARLARDGHVLLLGDSVVLLPGADDEAVELLGRLDQPFTTSRARQALGTSRRVVLSLLSHLDRTGRTVRLPDDTRRVR